MKDAITRVTTAIRGALKDVKPVTNVGIGRAKVAQVASNRRILGADGKVAVIRFSSSKLPAAHEGLARVWTAKGDPAEALVHRARAKAASEYLRDRRDRTRD